MRPLTLWHRLGASFTHVMALLLWAAVATALVAGMPELAVAIWLVTLINDGFSFWRDLKGAHATAALLAPVILLRA